MNKRIVYFDYLRVAATIGVILLHTASGYMWYFDSRSFGWNVLNFYEVMVRWAVPIFVMLSGSLFLSRELDIKRLYKKNILRLVVAFFVWSLFYALVTPLIEGLSYGEVTFSLTDVILNTARGNYHMWFVIMIIGMYMASPILKEIVRKKALAKYFILLSLVFVFLFPQAVSLSWHFTNGLFADVMGKLAELIIFEMRFSFVGGYTVYFLLGYLLEEAELTKKQRTVIYLFGIFGFVTSVALNAIVSWRTGEACTTYYEAFCINMFLVVVAVHTWFKYRDYPNETFNRFVTALSKYSFGAYLVHAFVLDLLDALGLHAITWAPIISVPIAALAATALSFGISWAIHKIPVLNQWVV